MPRPSQFEWIECSSLLLELYRVRRSFRHSGTLLWGEDFPSSCGNGCGHCNRLGTARNVAGRQHAVRYPKQREAGLLTSKLTFQPANKVEVFCRLIAVRESINALDRSEGP